MTVRVGAPFEKGDADGRTMPASLLSAWSGVDWAFWERERPSCPHPFGAELSRVSADDVFKEPDLHMTGLYRFPNGYATANIGHVFNLDGTDERSLTKGYLRGLESMCEYERYFRNYLKRAVFSDEIERCAYPIDIHPSSADKAAYERQREGFDRLYRYARGESYGIPYRILCAKGVRNLLVAGRCVSTDQKVQSSIRVMPACYLMEQAAGFAAALAAESPGNVHAISVPALQRRLLGQKNCPARGLTKSPHLRGGSLFDIL